MNDREELGRQASIDGFAHEHIIYILILLFICFCLYHKANLTLKEVDFKTGAADIAIDTQKYIITINASIDYLDAAIGFEKEQQSDEYQLITISIFEQQELQEIKRNLKELNNILRSLEAL